MSSIEPMLDVYRIGQLQVKVEENPIGGYRGQIGTLTIHHIDGYSLAKWSDEDLQNLAVLQRKILYIQEQAQVKNTLIFGREEAEQFKLSLIPYPKCNWIEKIQGLIHVIFGTPALTDKQADQIAKFYSNQLEEEVVVDPENEHRDGKPDVFCRTDVIKKQKITDISIDSENYYLLHDNRPKGASKKDPHLLIIPTEDNGHCDGSKVSEEKRFHMLKIARKAIKILLKKEHCSTILFLERNGKHLQGVQHKHQHVIGITKFPSTFLEKVSTLIHQIFTPVLSNLQERIEHYQQYNWKIN